MDRYDSIIIGAGHNGLVCGASLARAGQRVLIVEAGDSVGGLAARREFHPGFHAAVAHAVTHFPRTIAKALDLAAHGFETSPRAPKTTGLALDGNHRSIVGDVLDGSSDKDAAACRRYVAMMQRFAGALAPFWLKAMPPIGNNSFGERMTFAQLGLNLRRLGKADMREFLRIIALPTRDLMDEFFDDDLVKGMLSWDGLVGAKLAPRSPNNAVAALLYRLHGETGHKGLVEALHAAALDAGADIRTGTPVGKVAVEAAADGLTAAGVHLGNGERIAAHNVVSSADPRTTFFKLVGVEHLEIGFTSRIRRLRCDGYVAKLNLALNTLPSFTGLDEPDGRMIIAPHPDAIEFAFDDAKYGECSRQPVMEVTIPSLRDPSLAPAGKHVLCANVMYIPYRRKGGWTDDARNAACERAIDTLEVYAPGIRDCIAHREMLTPYDLERSFNVTGGHWHHTEFAIDQLLMMRPTYEAGQYRTPIPGLYLCGAGSHPGGDLTGAPGFNAARVILQ